jgi:replicative DNA helicase
MQLKVESPYAHVSVHMDKTLQMIRDIASGKIKPLVSSLRKEMDVIKGYFPSDQTTIGGRSGCGKTSYMIQQMNDFLDEELNPHYVDKLILLYDSWELTGWRNSAKFLGHKAKMTMHEIFDYEKMLNDDRINALDALSKEFVNKPLFISEISDNVVSWVKYKKQIQQAYPNHTIVNIVDHTRLLTYNNAQTEEANLTLFMKEAKKLKNEHNMINFFLTQMNRNIETAIKREDMGKFLPAPSDIFGSDAVMQTSDTVMLLHRPALYGLREFEYGGAVFATGLTQTSSEDHLMINNVVKNRYGDVTPFVLAHEVKYNRFFNFDPNKHKVVANKK